MVRGKATSLVTIASETPHRICPSRYGMKTESQYNIPHNASPVPATAVSRIFPDICAKIKFRSLDARPWMTRFTSVAEVVVGTRGRMLHCFASAGSDTRSILPMGVQDTRTNRPPAMNQTANVSLTGIRW